MKRRAKKMPNLAVSLEWPKEQDPDPVPDPDDPTPDPEDPEFEDY